MFWGIWRFFLLLEVHLLQKKLLKLGKNMNCYFILWQETVSKIYFSSLLEDRHTQTASCETRKNEVLVIDMVFNITNHVKLHHACCFQWRPIFYVWQPFYNFRLPKGDFEKHCTCSTEMAGKEEQSCSSCFKNTKYDCLWCQEYYCMPCSVFEDDETVKGWSGQFSRMIIVNHVSEKLSMEEHEKVERNDSNETDKNRDLQKQEDPGLSLSPYMK